ncbi:MAG: Succinate dehydrogenase cytochrome b558 subunit [Chlamydiae bacterium]|nr:Succinate dehydrogenase cytochrome b558 subunit [Chlamydiota bacterium]
MTSKLDALPKAFIWRRLHSLTGMWFVLFLVEHLTTNSQAALLLGDSGKGFIRMVNFIHDLPYLTVIEVTLLGLPILIHMVWGVRYSLTAKPNSIPSDGSKPHLKYSRNRAYTWQRITSWILVILLTMHIVKFRFLEYPESVNVGTPNPTYYVKVSLDPGLYTVAQRLDVKLYDMKALDQMRQEGKESRSDAALFSAAKDLREKEDVRYSPQDAVILQTAQSHQEKQKFVNALTSVHLKRGEVAVAAPTFGTATLLSVRDTFKSPVWVAVYSVFVLSAAFHAFNGLWTSMLTWGWMIRAAAQTGARRVTVVLMIAIAALGLIAVWGTYFLNLKH